MAKNVTIALRHIPQGIALALDRARDLLEDARVLAEQDAVLGGSVLFSQGVEELGKAKLLKDALDAGRPVVLGFGRHDEKLNAAASLLPADHLTLFEGAFQRNAFQSNAFDVGTFTDWATRIDSLYTNWGGTAWRPLPRLDIALLRDNVAKVLAFIAARRKDW